LAAAQSNVGVMYKNGEGTPQDDKSAHMWSNLAVAAGNETAKNNRDIVVGMMTSADISDAQEMASDWMKAHP
jgi:TPR repeat protein